MSEDAPLEPVAPEPVTVPTEPVPTEPVSTTTGTGPPPWPSPTVTAEAPQPPRRSSVSIPTWLLFVVGAVVIAALGFAVGWIAAPGSEQRETLAPSRGSALGPFGNGGGSGNQPSIPLPAPQGVRRAFLGVATNPSSDPAGVRIVRVVPGSPAAKAGLKVDDVITKVDDNAVARPEQLATRIGAHQRGDQVTITYVRGGATETARVTLARRSSLNLPTPSTTQPRL